MTTEMSLWVMPTSRIWRGSDERLRWWGASSPTGGLSPGPALTRIQPSGCSMSIA